MDENLSALERNVRLRNGRRALPVMVERPFVDDALETLGHIVGYAAVAGMIAGAMYLGLSIADTQYARIDANAQESVRHLPPCVTEDSDNCYWDAKKRGNGKGHSFRIVNGVVHYVD